MANDFTKDMKRIQTLVGTAYQKTGSLMAMTDGGKLPAAKLQRTLEETAGYFEAAVLETRTLCEQHFPEAPASHKKQPSKVETPTGHIELAGCGWMHIQLNTLLPHCRYQSPEWLSDTIRYMLTKYMAVTEYHLWFRHMVLVMDEHSSIPNRGVYDQDNKGWKAISNALKGLVLEDDDQYHLSLVMLSQQSRENVCHISLVLPESMEDFFHMRQKGQAYRPLEPSVEVDMKFVFPFIHRTRKTDRSKTADLLQMKGSGART